MVKSFVFISTLALLGTALAQSKGGSKYDNPTAGPPSSLFAAAPTAPVSALQSAAAKANKPAKDATYPVTKGGKQATIHSDWSKFNEVRFSFISGTTKLSKANDNIGRSLCLGRGYGCGLRWTGPQVQG